MVRAVQPPQHHAAPQPQQPTASTPMP